MKAACFVAGKSGGHIIPALTLAQLHKKKYPHDTIVFFCTQSDLDTQLVATNPIVDIHVPLELDNVPRNLLSYPAFILKNMKAFFKSIRHLYRYKPSSVTTTGSYVAIPVCIAAWLLRIPVTLLELNAKPGKAIQVLTPFARHISVCFRGASKYFPTKKCRLEPYPIRFAPEDTPYTAEQIREKLGFTSSRKTLFILGGSQGSLFINNLIKEVISFNPLADKIQIIHQTGSQDSTDWKSFYSQAAIPALVFSYHDNVQEYYRSADIIICRSGAGTLWELLFFNKRFITIPLQTATTDHQIDNARSIALEYPHLCTMLTQDEIMADKKSFAQRIEQICL